MNTPDRELDEIMKKINMDEVRRSLDLGEAFTISVSKENAQVVLEECGLIYNPKTGSYQSLEEGDRWKVDAHDGTVHVSPDPILYDTTAVGTINNMSISAGTELKNEKDMLDGLLAGSDSPEGRVIDEPKKPVL